MTATGTPTRTHVAPIARDNEADANAITAPTIVGNMITTVDAMYGVDADASGTGVLVLKSVNGTTAPSGGAGVPVTGTYGTLTIHEDGSWTYDVGTSLPGSAEQRWADRDFVEDWFEYTIVNGLGMRSEATAQLRITKLGDATVTATGTPTRTHVAPIARDNEADAECDHLRRRLSGT